MEEIETLNKFLVSSVGNGKLAIMNPPRLPISADDALLLAAWLVAMAAPHATRSFEAVSEALEST